MTFRFEPSYTVALPGTFLSQHPDPAPAPELLALNEPLAEELGLDLPTLRKNAAQWFSGASLPPGAEPVALAYSGHQFGGFSPVLGDGRAHLLGEFLTPDGSRFDLQLKGSGRTAFSRGGDGKAAVGPMLREYLISEAMAALGVPTTRSLAVVATGETVWRDAGGLPGAVLARVAASHIRVGTFQFLASRGEGEKLRNLADYSIERHYPELMPLTGPARYLGFFNAVMARQARLIASWMGLGFIHGVMNTDNMAISGETIDYGPCAFMDDFAPGTVFSSIDHQGRYAWGNQPHILAWNLARLAECLLPLFDTDEKRAVDLANEALGKIAVVYRQEWLDVMRRKLGLEGAQESDGALVDDLLILLQGVDWTLFFRRLARAATKDRGDEAILLALFDDKAGIENWLVRWRARAGSDADALVARLLSANPAVIPRNHRVEEVLTAATAGDLEPFRNLISALRKPYQESEGYMMPPPKGFGPYVTYCGT